MFLIHRLAAPRVLIGAILLTLGLVAGPLTAQGAGATFSTCDLDPVLTLADGTTITITAHVNAQASDIRQVTYVVHGPVGTTMVGATFDAGPLGALESAQYVPDTTDNSYSVSVVVDAATPTTDTTTELTVTPAPSGPSTSGTSDSSSSQTPAGDGDSHGSGHDGKHRGDSGHNSGHGSRDH